MENQTITKLFRGVAAVLVCATMVLRAHADPGTALHFNGTNSYVNIPHSPTLNAYPLTITAWVRTLRNASQVDGIVCKYLDASFNGYAVHLYNGHLYAFFLRSGGSVLPTSVGIDGGAIADGNWHHIAFVITSLNGQLYVDGNLANSASWSGTAGPVTGTEPLQIGRYNNYPNTFQGDIDEVTLWNRALSANELNYLKHRSLGGREDGLLGNWRFDEGGGTTASNFATNAFNGFLSNSPAWVASQAAIALYPIATNCLKFDGATGYVQVAHNTDLNAYPFSATGWFRTTNAVSFVQGIVSKYKDSSGNGWALFVQNGKLRGFYIRPPSIVAMDATSVASVADGAWHHAALTVDATGGKLYLDGSVVGSGIWASTPGASTNSESLLMGCYDPTIYTQRFQGALDEITVWNRTLTAGEIQTNRNLPLKGNEPNLIAYWRFDEGLGTTITDSTGFGHTGSFVSTPVWTGSTAYLGDGSVHLVSAPGIPNFARTFAINTAPGISPIFGKDSFQISARGFFRRFYDFGPTPPSVALVTLLDGGLQISGPSTPIPVKPNTVTNSFSMTAYNASTPQPLFFGSVASLSSTIYVQPNGVNLDSVNNLHEGINTLSHNENGGAFSNDGSAQTDATRLLHFNGHVMFGGIDTIVTNILNTPVPGSIVAPSYIQSQLQLAGGGAYFALSPSFTFGGGAAFTVNLGVDGTATNVNGSFSLVNPYQFLEANGIRYRLPGAALNASGMVASNLEAWFPSGFGMTLNTNVRTMLPYASKTNITIGPDLLPTTSPVVFTAASYNTNRLYFADETKPLIFGAPQIEWRIPEGQFYIAAAQTMEFVRQTEDDDLLTHTNVIGVTAGDRISNDGYYRNAVSDGTPIVIRPDTNNASLLTMNVLLQPTEYRPHFPYMNRDNGGNIPSIGGAISIVDDLVDPASYLFVSGPVPVPYARDCGPDGGCIGSPTNGPQVLNITVPAGGLGTPHLNFTSDGGLLAYGSLTAPTNLTWGFLGGADYAQRTSDVQDGAVVVAGTFLRGDLSTTPAAQKPAALLFTGWGDETNSAYLERPDLTAYNDGFANYPGLNFRRPVQGRSFIAGQDSGWYPLTPRAKYYTRYGGVSGIHEAQSIPNPNLTLYGYPFNFASYRLSFLDSDNRESRTDGQVTLPFPSGFFVEFQRMKFLCRGNLDTAQLPPTIDRKLMVYWNTYIKPQSLQFKPRSNNACSLNERYLVLGVETKLPFIPQAFHAALAFKNNGNLANINTQVEGVDSRFAVPANLQLQGPGGSFYPLTTAGDGYFNNWDTGKTRPGFFNITGRARVPFFRDVKIQLHVTPLSETDASIAMMGGWPAEEGLGANRGWNIGTQNYFNTPKFDPNADGWPTSITLDSYHNPPDDNYRPRAQRNWIDVAFFDYPLAWNLLLHQFEGFTKAPVTLPVIDVDSNLKELTPGKVDLDFAQDINLKLPRIKVLDLANDAINELNAPIITLSNAIRSAIQQQINTSGLTSGFRSLQNMMRENTEGFFRPILEPALDPVVDNLYPVLANALAVSKANLLATTSNTIAASSNHLQFAIQSINGTAADANKVFGQVNNTLKDVDDTLGLFQRVLEKDGEGNRHVVRVIVQKLTQDQVPGLFASLTDSVVNDQLAELEPTLAKIEAELTELRSQFNQVREQIGHVTLDNDFNEALDTANHDGQALQNYVQQASYAVSNLLNDAVGPAGDYFTSNPARAKAEIRERLLMAFLSSPIPGKYQQTFKQFLYDKDFLLDQLMDVLFDQINRAIRNGAENQIAGAKDGLFQNLKGAGLLSQSLASAKIRGAPTFEGDSLRKIHLDSDIKVNLPDEMKFTAYMDIKELNSATTPIACIPAGAPSAEVTLGANDVPLDWSGVPSTDPTGKKMTLSLAARWTLQSGAVKGIGGSLDIKGSGGFKGCNMAEFRCALAIGSIENYFAGQAKATVIVVGIPVDFRAGIFAGHACSLDALKFIDPEVEQVVQQPGEFSGVYVEYGGGLSLSDLLFGESSDLLDVRADVTYAMFYQGGPRFGRLGGRQKVSVDIKLLYVLEGSASWAEFIILDTSGQLTVGGSAEVCGRIGVCPLCAKGCKDVRIKGVINDGGIDYFIDY